MSMDIEKFMSSRWGFWLAVLVLGLVLAGIWGKADERYLKKEDFKEWKANQGLTTEMKEALAILTASAQANKESLIKLTGDVDYLRQDAESRKMQKP